MSIGKKGMLCTVTYPDGKGIGTSIGYYTGNYTVIGGQTNDGILSMDVNSALLRGEALEFDIPPADGVWQKWTFKFNGTYDGADLPSFSVNLRRFEWKGDYQTDISITGCSVNGVVLINNSSFSGGITYNENFKKWFILITKRDGVNTTITVGNSHTSSQGYYAYPIANATKYFDSTREVNFGFPYGDGESTSQGGQGEMIDTSDPIEIDSKPLLTTGDFLRVYKMTATDLSALQAKLISNGFLDNLIAKLRTDAMDYIVGLNAIPINAANVASSTIKIANLDTGINASYLSWYIEDIDFGEIALTEYFQTFMDYSPYTKLSVYIPYCGIVPLNVDNFMNDKISMKCRVDMLTGQFVVFVSNSTGIVTTVSGNCAYQLPIRANDYNRLVTSGLGLLGGIVGTAGALATGNVPLAIGAGLGTIGGLVATSQAMTKPDVTSKGSLGGNYGLLGNRTPYLIIQRPTISVPSDYGKTIGYMSRITAKLGDLTGYTILEEIHLEHISATDDEKKLIENALKSGVIL